MKGLIIKDLFTIKQQTKIYSFMMLLFGTFALISDSPAYFWSITCMITIMLPVTALSYDERANWDKYALSMPVSRKDIVRSKYGLGGITTFAGCVLIFIFSVIQLKDLSEALTAALIFWFACVFLLSVLMPVLIKFGVEKGRIIMLGIFFTPLILVMIANTLHAPIPDMDALAWLKYILPIFVLAFVGFSYFLSYKLYLKKDF